MQEQRIVGKTVCAWVYPLLERELMTHGWVGSPLLVIYDLGAAVLG